MSELLRWHLAAIAAAPVEPDPVAAATWRRWDEHRREDHIAALRTWLGSRYVETDEIAAAVAGIDQVVDGNRYTPAGAKQIAVLTGPFAVGKSTVVNRWARRRHRFLVGQRACEAEAIPQWSPSAGITAHLVPVVRINLQAGARIKEFDAQLLSFLGYPTTGVARSMTERLVTAAAMHRVQVVVVDDVHLLKTNWKGGRDVLDHLKHINTELGEQHATLVLVGADLEHSAIVTDPQIAGRLALHAIGPCKVDTVTQQQAWLQVLAALEEPLLRHLPRTREGVLRSATAGLVWRRTQGFLGDLTGLVHSAAELALRDGSLSLSRKHLEAAPVSHRAARARVVIEAKKRRPPVTM